jgi:glutaredoxin 3
MKEIKIKENLETNYSKIVKDLITETKIILFSKSYCPYCKKLKNYLDEEKINYKFIEIDHMNQKFQSELTKYSNMSTVPQFFIGGKLIGIFL